MPRRLKSRKLFCTVPPRKRDAPRNIEIAFAAAYVRGNYGVAAKEYNFGKK